MAELGPPVDCEKLFLSELDLIDRIVGFVARRHRLPPAEADDFGSLVRLKLIESNYAVLRRFESRSSLRTYLTTVIERVYLDYRVRERGKWRPSAAARREGPLAIRLEALLGRDGLSFDEACEQLSVEQGNAIDRNQLHRLHACLPARAPRRTVSEEWLSERPDSRSADDHVAALEQQARTEHANQCLASTLSQFSSQDRLILQLRFGHGLTIADISRALCLEAKPLYRRLECLLGKLRQGFERQGINDSTVAAFVGRPDSPSEWARHSQWRDARARPAAAEAARLQRMSRDTWNLRTLEGLRQSISFAGAALAADPAFGPAHAALGLSYVTLASYTPSDPSEFVALARQAAGTALRASHDHWPDEPDATRATGGKGEADVSLLDCDIQWIGTAHTVLGWTHLCFDREWAGAEREFALAAQLNPQDATVRQWCSFWALATRNEKEALRLNRAAQELEPTSTIISSQVAWVLYFLHRFDEAVLILQALAAREPSFWRIHFNLALCLAALGRPEDAQRAIEQAAALNDYPIVQLVRAHICARRGAWREATAHLDACLAAPYCSPYWLAYAYAAFRDGDEVIKRLTHAIDGREWYVILLALEPAFDFIRSDPRFSALLRAANLE